jgi:hypothetical protein
MSVVNEVPNDKPNEVPHAVPHTVPHAVPHTVPKCASCKENVNSLRGFKCVDCELDFCHDCGKKSHSEQSRCFNCIIESYVFCKC